MIDEEANLHELAAAVAGAAMRSATAICTAESCTGGALAYLLAQVPGVSAVFQGSVVAYANIAKVEILGVPVSVLDAYGAVSEQVARAMARGACRRLHASVGVSTTGIAGPSGGTDAKPVGLVYIAVYGPDIDVVTEFRFAGGRAAVIRQATREALHGLERALSARSNCV